MPIISITLPPITITKSGGVINPVSLSSVEVDPALDPALVVVYSDGSKKVVLTDSDNRKYKTAAGTATGFDVTDGCDSIKPYDEELPAGYDGDTIVGNFNWSSCQMNGDAPQGEIIMEFDDYVAKYDATQNEEDTFLPATLADWVINEQ